MFKVYVKKIIFLVPLVLLALNATPWALYKNNVNYSSNGQLYHLLPSYWRQLDITVAKAAHQSVYNSTIIVSSTGTQPLAIPLSHGAHFLGFPVGFYLKNNDVITNSLPGTPAVVTAFSWLWVTVDSLLFVAALAICIWVNHRRTSPSRDSS
ncbi:MAG TPA: hypothetical protein VMR16_02955 [Candidatus Saccharimonadales bacterium]|jgi:hypothetical protein|nr:hypothetical protein [Candidatus Saccharimonadales bacterium]